MFTQQDHLIYEEIYVHKVYDKYTIKPLDVVVDAGAHKGFFTRKAASQGAVVYAFEPEPNNYKVLSDLMLIYKNICVYKQALWNTVTELQLERSLDNTGGHSLKRKPHDYINSVTVSTNYLDNFYLSKLDLFKIDVEGAEVEVLEGARATINRCRPHIVLEVHNFDLYAKVKQFLEILEYNVGEFTASVIDCEPL